MRSVSKAARLGEQSSVAYASESRFLSLGLERRTQGHQLDQILKPVTAASEFLHDAVHLRTIQGFDSAAAGVAQQSLRERPGELNFTLDEYFLQAGHILE